jgi:hypothetical protein
LDVRLAAGTAAVAVALAPPAGASAAALSVSPLKPCYRSPERVDTSGSGFTPGGTVNVSVEGRVLGTTTADASGNIFGRLDVTATSERVKTFTATDQSNTAINASVSLRISPVVVRVVPRNGPPGRRLRITARGFTTGRQLYAHVVLGSRRRNVRIGRLRDACGRLTVRKRLFPSGVSPGSYVVQFDARRRYSRRTRVKVRFRVTVFPVFGPRASQTWMSG